MPTTEEIRQKCLEFQAGWSDEERERRRVGGMPKPIPYEVPVVPEALFRVRPGDDDDAAKTFLEDLMDTSG